MTKRAIEKNRKTYYYHADGLGSITALTDSTGKKIKTYSYKVYGAIASQTGTLTQPYMFTGREYDPETGLYFYRARYYDPNVGRFISEDPIGFAGGDVNLYRYVFNNSVNYTDPMGLAGPLAPAVPLILACISNPSCVKTVERVGAALTGIAIGTAISNAIDKAESDKCDDDDKCEKIEKECKGYARNVVSHVQENHLHPKPCNDLSLMIMKAISAGCSGKPGVQYAVNVYNTHCVKDCSNQYPNNTPNFPPF